MYTFAFVVLGKTLWKRWVGQQVIFKIICIFSTINVCLKMVHKRQTPNCLTLSTVSKNWDRVFDIFNFILGAFFTCMQLLVYRKRIYVRHIIWLHKVTAIVCIWIMCIVSLVLFVCFLFFPHVYHVYINRVYINNVYFVVVVAL